eukprot:jgi/Botrbrau1/18134/Bobra.53_1s0011.1
MQRTAQRNPLSYRTAAILLILFTCITAAAAVTTNDTNTTNGKAAAPQESISDAIIDPIGTEETANITETASKNDTLPPVDYSQFSRMLAGMLILREGGIPEATRAIPGLGAEAFNYLGAQIMLNKHPEIKAKLQNFSDFHSHKSKKAEKPDLLTKISGHMREKGEKLGKHISKKKDQEKTAKIQGKINKIAAKFTDPQEMADIGELNQFLSKFNIVVIPKAISAPKKYSNFATAISSLVTGLQASVSGVVWAPSIISYGAVGLRSAVTGLSITPAVLAGFPSVMTVLASGVYIQPALLGVFPDGVNIQPAGVTVAPNLFVAAPTGVNILPQGVSVAASGFVEASTGVNVQSQGVSWGPVNHFIP